jgi:hypothetical protein
MKRRQLDSISLERRAKATAHVFGRRLPLALRSLEKSRFKATFRLEKYCLGKHPEIPNERCS